MNIRTAASLLVLLLAVGIHRSASAQFEGIPHISDPVHQFLLRQQAAGALDHAFLQHLPLSADEIRGYLDSIDESALTPTDRKLLEQFRGERPLPGVDLAQSLWDQLYRDGIHLISTRGDGYFVSLDPTLYLTAGRVSRPDGDDRHRTTFQNTRGVRASGRIGEHLFFETRLEENQRRDAWPNYQRKTAPRLGGTKFYPESQEYDYWRAMGTVGVQTRFVEIRAGRDRNRWGDGLSSMFLSDYAPEYDQVQIRTTFWRLQYINLYSAWTDYASINRFSDHVLPRKYGALHALAVNLPGRVQLHFYESVTFAPDYEDDRRRGYDLSYLNPIIFYRAVEIDRGSPDSMQLGAGASWVPVPGLKLFAQGLLTEFNLDELLSGDGWFGNKWGVAGGFTYAPPSVSGLLVHFEHARVRPFTYSHRDIETSFVHYNDPLGHPAEQNFYDYTLHTSYQPLERWSGRFTMHYTRRGRNPDGVNEGADPRLSYATRSRSHGHSIGQGVPVREMRVEMHAGYEVLPRLHLEIAARVESINDGESGRIWYVNPFAQLRWGIPFQSLRL